MATGTRPPPAVLAHDKVWGREWASGANTLCPTWTGASQQFLKNYRWQKLTWAGTVKNSAPAHLLVGQFTCLSQPPPLISLTREKFQNGTSLRAQFQSNWKEPFNRVAYLTDPHPLFPAGSLKGGKNVLPCSSGHCLDFTEGFTMKGELTYKKVSGHLWGPVPLTVMLEFSATSYTWSWMEQNFLVTHYKIFCYELNIK